MIERKKIILLMALCVILLSVGWLRICGLPLLVALVPLMIARQRMVEASVSRIKIALVIFSTFLIWNLATIWWVSKATLFGGAAAVIVGTLLPTLVFMWYDGVARRASRLFGYTFLIVLWLCYEELYMNGQLAFPWLILGNGFADTVWAVQWYEYTGVFGGSLWVLLSNIFVYEALRTQGRRSVVVGAVVTIFLPLIISLTIWCGYEAPAQREVSVHIIQPNIDPYTEKFEISQHDQNNNILALASEAPDTVDFIVAPETAIDDRLWEGSLAASPTLQRMTEFMKERYPQSAFIIGATTMRQYPNKATASSTARKHRYIDAYYDVYNSALIVDTSARYPIHHKSKLVVGVERTPYHNLLKKVDFLSIALGGVAGQLGYDAHQRIFNNNGVDYAVPICYESVYGEYFAGFTTRGAQLMFVITNDGWWGETAGHRQHFDYSRLRAVETRRAIVRSANTGISGVITPRGDVIQTLGWDQRGTITASVPLNSRQTFYARTGDAIVRLAWFVLTLCVLVIILESIKRRRKAAGKTI